MLRKIHGQLVTLRVVEALQLLEGLHVSCSHHVDGHTLSAVTPRSPDTVQIRLPVGRQVKIDHNGHVLHVNPARQQVRGDEHTRAAGPESGHNLLTLSLGHVGMHEADGELLLVHLVRQPVHLPAGVAEDHRLGNRDTVVQIHEGLQLVLLLHCNIELLDTLQGKGLLLDQDAVGLPHELAGEVQHIRGHGGGEQGHLDVLGQELEDLVDLLRKPLGQHLIGLIQHQALQRLGAQGPSFDDIINPSGSADCNNHPRLQLADVVHHAGASHEGGTECRVRVRQEIPNM
mmetsp:Transcript_9405/g.17649  ORF Transcript_9405/g.17649 Transcript_9405/m.17649 type:complete len:287 (+) Transcript_9405:270-1130(+)